MSENEQLKSRLADLTAELDTIIDNPEVPFIARQFVNTAANYLAQAYVSLPGRFNNPDGQVTVEASIDGNSGRAEQSARGG